MEKLPSNTKIVYDHITSNHQTGDRFSAIDISNELNGTPNRLRVVTALREMEKHGVVSAVAKGPRALIIWEYVSHEEMKFAPGRDGAYRPKGSSPRHWKGRELPRMDDNGGILAAVGRVMEVARAEEPREEGATKPLSEQLLDIAIQVEAMERELQRFRSAIHE